jgi:D-alanyl-D-alanine carboxypeptidase/Putative peptidoglycan binding domain
MADLTAVYGKPCQTSTFVTVHVFGFKIPIVKHAANALLRAAIDAYDTGYKVHRIESYNCRKTVSGTSWSAHAWAAAVDINPEQNPFSSAGVLKTNMPREFRAAFKDHGWGWGGDWDSVKDAMHFSMDKGEGGDALKQAYNRDLQEEADDKWDGRPPHHEMHFGIEPAPSWRHEHPGNVDNPHMNCDTVGHWQKQMKKRGWTIAVDGDYGNRSEQVCRAFQREKRLHVDGILGPKTWRMAWEAPIT